MDDRSIGIVVTTVSNGEFLDSYWKAVREWSHSDRVCLYVIGDVSTPAACRDRASALREKGFRCEYYDVDRQNEFLRPFSAIAGRIPFRSDNRRNVGYLLAFRDRRDIIISVDDDNIPIAGTDFLVDHSTMGATLSLPVTQGRNGWFNLGALLETQAASGGPVLIYPRGFPYARRFDDKSRVGVELEPGTVGVNVGLWTGDPDVDAATRLVTRCTAPLRQTTDCFLGRGQRCPINSQNTALCWQAIPAYYFVLMGHEIAGLRMDRFGDIFSGYFLQLCAEAVGHHTYRANPQSTRIAIPTICSMTSELNCQV